MRYVSCWREALLTLALVTTVTGSVMAQTENAVITGRVTNEMGSPIDYANATIVALNASVGTNANGTYTITIPGARVSGQDVVLRVRAIGYRPETRQIRITPGTQTF